MYDPQEAEKDWWKRGVVYQVYPRSFADSDGDGVGDLNGITTRLDHLEWLGVDGIWISPMFRSPMADFGYDVSDYCDVDPIFGNLADLDRLVDEAHRRGMKVLLDFVPNHSSDQHQWFIESRASRSNPKRDWYWWREPGSDGGPPNNWQSNFLGPAWTLDDATGQYYLHLFLSQQPDLNWANPEVVAAMHDVLRFWLERGIDGFRIDVVHAMAKDAQLRDNPRSPQAGQVNPVTGRSLPELIHAHDVNQPEVHDIIRGFRRIFDEYGATSVGEVYLLDPSEMARYYGNGHDELHMAFNFAFLWSSWRASSFRRRIEQSETLLPQGAWPNYTLSNHDHRRHVSRYGASRAKAAALMLLALRGTPFIYYGEEIGMPDVAEAGGHDPVGRDPERTPMQWDGSPTAGFTAPGVVPWLPFGPLDINVADQRDDPDSVLSFYRRLIALRRDTPALHSGDLTLLDGPDDVLMWRRAGEIDVAINMGTETIGVAIEGTVLIATDRRREGQRLSGSTIIGQDEGLLARR